MGDSVESLAEVKVDTVLPSSFQAVISSLKAIRLAKHDFPLMNAC